MAEGTGNPISAQGKWHTYIYYIHSHIYNRRTFIPKYIHRYLSMLCICEPEGGLKKMAAYHKYLSEAQREFEMERFFLFYACYFFFFFLLRFQFGFFCLVHILFLLIASLCSFFFLYWPAQAAFVCTCRGEQ